MIAEAIMPAPMKPTERYPSVDPPAVRFLGGGDVITRFDGTWL